jgi:anti-sigma regulatory factor (Ser/Thr protein kinase)
MPVSSTTASAGRPNAVYSEIPLVRPGDRGCLMDLPCRPESARPARMLVTAALTSWAAEELGDVAELLVSELVANAAKHTGCARISISVNRQKASVWVGVRDSSGALPCRTESKGEEESGYGLRLVEALSSRWGVSWAPRGKWVWFELRTT